jgi:8-oxo-dGTP diphosphatase
MPTSAHRILSVLCYVVRDDHVLMMLRRKQPNLGQWTAPGGKVEWDEAPVETCIREMQEETGLTVVRPELRAIITEVSPVDHYQWTMFCYVAHEFTGEVGATHEGDLAWIPLPSLDSLPLPQADRIFGPRILDWDGTLFNGKFYYDADLRLERWEDLG